jgi:hypothetical protein
MLRFSLKTLLIAIAVFATALGVWPHLFRTTAYIRSPRTDDTVGRSKTSLPRVDDEEVRNVLFLRGKFNQSTRLYVSLIAVQAGQLEVQNRSILSCHHADHAAFPSTSETMLVLRSSRRPAGKVTYIDHRGILMSGNSIQSKPHNIPSTFTYALSASIVAGRPYIAYVEGNNQIDASCDMTLGEFAKKNSGNYFVVTVEIR